MFSAKALSMATRRSVLRSLPSSSSSKSAISRDGGRRFMGSGVPVPNSMKARLWEGHPTAPEGWESTIYFYYTVSFFAIFAIINFSPDTSIEAWAQQEAKARLALKAQGFTDFEFGKHYQDEMMNNEAANWDKFSMKAIKPGEDDDDDEDEDEEEGAEEGDDDDDDDDE